MCLKKRVAGVLLFLLPLALAQNAYSEVLINEILANGLDDPEHEWVELHVSEKPYFAIIHTKSILSYCIKLLDYNIISTTRR